MINNVKNIWILWIFFFFIVNKNSITNFFYYYEKIEMNNKFKIFKTNM